jgi:hypothetical protein
LPAATGGSDVGQAEVELDELLETGAELGATGAKLAGCGAVLASEGVELPIDPAIADEPAVKVPELNGVLITGVRAATVEDVEGWVFVATEGGAAVAETSAGLLALAPRAEMVPALGAVKAAGELIEEGFASLALLISWLAAVEASVLSTGSRIRWAVGGPAAATASSS